MATVNLDCKLDLKTIAFHAKREYNPKVRNLNFRSGRAQTFERSPRDGEAPRFLSHDSHERALTSDRPSPSAEAFRGGMCVRAPKTTALIFSSGKMVCTGAETEALAREAARTPR